MRPPVNEQAALLHPPRDAPLEREICESASEVRPLGSARLEVAFLGPLVVATFSEIESPQREGERRLSVRLEVDYNTRNFLKSADGRTEGRLKIIVVGGLR